MNAIMSRAELETLYPDEWILMVDPEPGDDTNYRGQVVAHSSDRAQIHQRAMELPTPRHIAIFFTGPVIPPGMKLLGLPPCGYVSTDPVRQVERRRGD